MMFETIECETHCPLCGASAATVVALKDGKTGEPLTTVSCDTCGLGRIDPLPTRQALELWYATRYRQEYKKAETPALRHVLRAGRNALQRWAWLQQRTRMLGVGWGSGASSLDIGASSGEFVYLMHRLGFAAQGLEPHVGYAGYARQEMGLVMHTGSLHNVLPQLPDQQFDVISMFHVLEHLADPVETLGEIRRKIKPEGILFIEVPNATRFCSPHYMFFRAHTLYFTQASLHQTLTAAGWKVLAHNEPYEGNLLVLASPAHQTAQCAWKSDDALIQAQRRRTWRRYLVYQLRTGRIWKKFLTRREEKRTARGYSSGRALLDHLYQPIVESAKAGRAASGCDA